MGGILLKEYAAGAEITIAITSRGEASSHGTPEQREAEAMAAARHLGAAERVHFLDFGGDGQQAASPQNAAVIARMIRETQPSVVFAPSPAVNQHPDHSAVGAAARDGCRLARYGGLTSLRDLASHTVSSLWYYAVTPGPEMSLKGAVLVDISNVFEEWKALMECHQSQVSQRKYRELQIARARQLGLMATCDYAMALWPNDPPLLESIRPLARTARGF
jgi:LmbE family N-acetylglucosaminyl deacetylase